MRPKPIARAWALFLFPLPLPLPLDEVVVGLLPNPVYAAAEPPAVVEDPDFTVDVADRELVLIVDVFTLVGD